MLNINSKIYNCELIWIKYKTIEMHKYTCKKYYKILKIKGYI